MILTHVVLIVCTCLCETKNVKLTTTTPATTEDEDGTMLSPAEEEDIEQKIALIDIVFIDGSKRTCTGAIIHDNVVITAGHCFMGSDLNTPYTRPELTASFVVIGTQAKFESGYEQYLPIERVVTHPHIKGWNSDLALVHTFASMTANKIGAIIPLATERNTMLMDVNFTIFSWGRIMDITPFLDTATDPPDENSYKITDFCVGSHEKYHDDDDRFRNYFRGRMVCNNSGKEKKHSHQPAIINSEKNALRNSVVRPLQHRSTPQEMMENYPLPNLQTTKIQSSRYLSSGEKKHEIHPLLHRFHKVQRTSDGPDEPTKNVVNKTVTSKPEPSKKPFSGLRKIIDRRSKTVVRSWRRQLGATEVNKLSVESFGLVNSRACKIMIDKVAPHIDIDMENIVCYASEDRYVTDADSGALAVRLGELVGITVGGIELEGDHIAIGMKLSQFCPWIAENLPASDFIVNCWATQGNPLYETIRDYDINLAIHSAKLQRIKKSKVNIYHHKNRYLDFVG